MATWGRAQVDLALVWSGMKLAGDTDILRHTCQCVVRAMQKLLLRKIAPVACQRARRAPCALCCVCIRDLCASARDMTLTGAHLAVRLPTQAV
jgi:hypothetical protein